jgi:hypothetical protein
MHSADTIPSYVNRRKPLLRSFSLGQQAAEKGQLSVGLVVQLDELVEGDARSEGGLDSLKARFESVAG